MRTSVIAGIFSGMAVVASPLSGARAAATACVGDEHAASRLVTAVEATGSPRPYNRCRHRDSHGAGVAYLLADTG